jgi:cytochrome oxidase assembly protein ShyY1
VTGVVQRTQERGLFGATDPASGRLRTLARVDLARFAKQVSGPIEPVYLLADGQTPPQTAKAGGAALPQQVQLELPTPSTNLSYMIQWWIFTLIAICGYPLVLRRVARNRARGDTTPDDVDEGDDVPVATGV